MGARTTRFWGPDYAPTSQTDFYTVPASKSALLRFIVLANEHSSAVLFGLRLNGTSGATRLLIAYSVPASGNIQLPFYLGLNAGDVLSHQCPTASKLIVTYSGYEYFA